MLSLFTQSNRRVSVNMYRFIVIIFFLLSIQVYGSELAPNHHTFDLGLSFISSINWRYFLSTEHIIFLLRIILSLLFGVFIGFAHTYKRKTELDIVTFSAVSVGAATFASTYTHFYIMTTSEPVLANLGSVTIGIGFLCAGVIFKDGFSIKGLRTSTSIWATSAIGVACGCGLFGVATVSFAIIFLLNIFRFKRREHS